MVENKTKQGNKNLKHERMRAILGELAEVWIPYDSYYESHYMESVLIYLESVELS